jgi:hypothetical protein
MIGRGSGGVTCCVPGACAEANRCSTAARAGASAGAEAPSAHAVTTMGIVAAIARLARNALFNAELRLSTCIARPRVTGVTTSAGPAGASAHAAFTLAMIRLPGDCVETVRHTPLRSVVTWQATTSPQTSRASIRSPARTRSLRSGLRSRDNSPMKRSDTWTSIARDKAELREKNAAQPFEEKLRVVERLRERDAAIQRARPSDRDAGKKEK